mmetsp:Transcript_24998/g.68632  ORF Transcript_24998/g.68632 Transcript_24998/m.68632 type:complete len:137 (-) Transcript_24998:506-916(-)|eukprot:scaffold39422_cov37-Tisochrysis_lutea.AAC.4
MRDLKQPPSLLSMLDPPRKPNPTSAFLQPASQSDELSQPPLGSQLTSQESVDSAALWGDFGAPTGTHPAIPPAAALPLASSLTAPELPLGRASSSSSGANENGRANMLPSSETNRETNSLYGVAAVQPAAKRSRRH